MGIYLAEFAKIRARSEFSRIPLPFVFLEEEATLKGGLGEFGVQPQRVVEIAQRPVRARRVG